MSHSGQYIRQAAERPASGTVPRQGVSDTGGHSDQLSQIMARVPPRPAHATVEPRRLVPIRRVPVALVYVTVRDRIRFEVARLVTSRPRATAPMMARALPSPPVSRDGHVRIPRGGHRCRAGAFTCALCAVSSVSTRAVSFPNW